MTRRIVGISAVILLAGIAAAFAISPAGAAASAVPAPSGADSDKSWIAKSNDYANILIEIEKKHSPESASHDGLKQYDELISADTHEDEVAEISENRAALAKLKAALAQEQDKNVKQDLEIMIHSVELGLRGYQYSEDHLVTYRNPSADVYQGIQVLLDDQVSADRRPAAVVRLRKYAGLEPGFTPETDKLKKLMELQMAKPNMIYSARSRVETALERNSNYVDGIASLFQKYNLQGWQEPYAKLKTQLTAYDEWIRTTVLPKTRTDFRQPPELYALSLENFGIDIPPADLAAMAHKAFTEYQGEMQTVAAQIAKQRGWTETDYRDVIKRLKQDQLVGDSILPFYKDRLKVIEGIIVKQNLGEPARSPGAHPHRHSRRKRAAASAAHGASTVAEQHRSAR